MLKECSEHIQMIQPLLTDLYQITMAYAYWKANKVKDQAVFDLFFRKNPFHGEFTIFAGLEQCLKFIETFYYSKSDIAYLKSTLPDYVEDGFYEFLGNLNTKDVVVYAIDEGSVVFPKVPMLRVEGPLITVQLLETTLLTLINFASLMTTNAVRYRIAAGDHVSLLEFGLRRSQGPDGGMSASKYAYIGGFDGTSNVLAGKMYDIPVKGTHAHSFVSSFSNISELKHRELRDRTTGRMVDLLEKSLEWRVKVTNIGKCSVEQVSDGELGAFVTYAIAFPTGFTALIDTYDIVRSGLINFSAVALALNDVGYRAIGIRIDSGDLAYLSNVSRELFEKIAKEFNLPWFVDLCIMASNDVNEETIWSLREQKHQINCFGIGTHLVTCQRQPALGCVFKLVELNGTPRMKLSQDVSKVTIPGRKEVYRLYGADGYALCDLIQLSMEATPKVKNKILCRHPFDQQKRAYALPSHVEPLYKVHWKDGKIQQPLPTLQQIREKVKTSLKSLRDDHKRYLNPTPYKVSVSAELYTFINEQWLMNAPIGDLS